MKMKKCASQQHSYYEDKFDSCPFCRENDMERKTREIKRDNHAKRETYEVKHDNQEAREVSSDSPKRGETRVIYSSEQSSSTDSDGAAAMPSDNEALPTVGWLVVIDGLGKGKDIKIRPGLNRIGRDAPMHICLNFGDEKISRLDNSSIMYDHEDKAFALTHDYGTNPTKVNGKRVPRGGEYLLQPYDRIRMGATTLLFIPLCGEHFDWNDV